MKWVVALLVVVPAVTTVAKEKVVAPPAAAPVRATRTVTLDEKGVYGIRTARNVLTTVEFPESMVTPPKCASCESPGSDGDGLFILDTSDSSGRSLTLRPNLNSRRRAKDREGDGETTVLVRLEHATLTLYVDEGDRRRADTRVVFVPPNRKTESEFVRAEREKMEAEVTARIAAGVTDGLLALFAEPHECKPKSAKARNENIVLEVNELCAFGREVVVVFAIENRGRTPLEVASVTVNRGSQAKEYVAARTIEQGALKSGAALLQLAKGERPSGRYDLTVTEASGQRRVVSVRGVEF